MPGELEEVTRRLIETKVLEALKSNDEYIETLVKAAFERDVDENGRTDGYSRHKQPWIRYAALDTIRQATWQVVREWVSQEVTPKLEDAVRKSVTNDEFVQEIIRAAVGKIDVHDMTVDVRFKQNDE